MKKCMYCGNEADGWRFMIPFPLNDENLLKEWNKNLGLCSNFTPYKSWRLCSDHFTEDCVQLNRRKLIPKSIPTLFDKRIWYYCFSCGVHQYEFNGPSLHTFPTHDAYLLKMWLKAIQTTNFVPSPTSLICDNHFEDNCFKNRERRKGHLHRSAIPTLFGQRSLTKENKKRSSESLDLPVPPVKSEKLSFNLNNTQNLTPGNFNDEQIAVEHEISVIRDVSSKESNNMTENLRCKPKNITQQTVLSEHNYATSPKKLRRKLLQVQEKNKKLKSVNRINQQKLTRMRKTINSLRDLVNHLRKTKPKCKNGFAFFPPKKKKNQ